MGQEEALSGCRVLVVEDELMIALDLCSILEALGCEVVGPIPSVGKALAALETHRPDVALLDENLVGATVAPVAERLERLHIPFAIVSGYNRPRAENPALAAARRLPKPTSAAAIRDVLQMLWRRSP